MQKARRHPVGLRPFVSVWFQVLLTPLLGVLFTFPSRYLFAIGLIVVFSLTRWCWWIQTGFHRSRLTQDTSLINICTCTGLSPSLIVLSNTFHLKYLQLYKSYNPCKHKLTGLGSSAFARHYSRNH